MKLFKWKAKPPTAEEKELARLFDKLSTLDPDTPEYAKVLTYIGRLNCQNQDNRPARVKRDTWVNAGAHIVGVAFVVGAESIGSRLLSKNALGMLSKPKL